MNEHIITEVKKPNFLGIGAIKCGTTWIANILQSHPDIFLAHGKEIHYFSRRFSEGEEFYLNHFASASSHKAIGEYSVSYLINSQEVAERIHEFNPGLKLIASIRHPVDRAWSEYTWMKQMNYELGPIRDAVQNVPALITNGMYAKNLEPYFKLFPRKQILIIPFQDIKNRPIDIQKEIYAFLEVEDSFDSKQTSKVIGKTISPRFQFLEKSRIKVHDYLKNTNKAELITYFKKAGLSNLYRKINNKKNIKDVLTQADREFLYNYFKDDIAELSLMSGHDFSLWR